MSRKTTIKFMDGNIDLLRIPTHVACKAINLWVYSSTVFTEEDFRELWFAREPAWLTARSRLIELGHVSVNKEGIITPATKKKRRKAA